jgi:flagellar motor switch protein FliM
MSPEQTERDGRPILLAQRSRDSEVAMPAVEDFFNEIALRIRSRLVNRSASDIQVRLAGVDVRTLGDVVEDTEYRESAVYGVMRFTPPGLPGLIVLQSTLLSHMVGAMLGEEPGHSVELASVRSLTPVEQQIARRICNDIADELVDAWPLGSPPRIDVERPSTTARGVIGGVRTVNVYSATLDFGPPTAPYGLMCCNIPVQVFRAIDGSTSVLEQTTAPRDVDMERVMGLEVEVVAEIARLRMSVQELEDLEVGDTLDVGPVRTALLKINDHPIIEGKPGEVDGHRSVQIRRRLS